MCFKAHPLTRCVPTLKEARDTLAFLKRCRFDTRLFDFKTHDFTDLRCIQAMSDLNFFGGVAAVCFEVHRAYAELLLNEGMIPVGKGEARA